MPSGVYERESRICLVKGCDKPHKAKGLCNMHLLRLEQYGRLYVGRRRKGTGSYVDGYKAVTVGGKQIAEHVLIAEKALGKKLPKGAIVHHVDENPKNNSNENLVICPNTSYHKIIHRRMKALSECGDPNKRRCKRCKQYDDPKNLVIGRNVYHRECINQFMREKRALRLGN